MSAGQEWRRLVSLAVAATVDQTIAAHPQQSGVIATDVPDSGAVLLIARLDGETVGWSLVSVPDGEDARAFGCAAAEGLTGQLRRSLDVSEVARTAMLRAARRH